MGDETTLVIFGISGDLSRRKLLPALDAIIGTGEFDNVNILGVSRRDFELPDNISKRVRERTSVFKMDLAEARDYLKLKKKLGVDEGKPVVIYLSVPPLAVSQMVRLLGEAGFNKPNVKVLFEKPFGIDLQSSRDMAKLITEHFEEEQVYRIDHYLAKEMAQNIVMLRRGNALLCRVWDKDSIEAIDIVASEEIGIEGRAEFYEQTGALRDVVQGHLMQLLALTLMKIPDNFSWTELPRLRLEALEKINPADPEKAVRGQYNGYTQEAGNRKSMVETFVMVPLESEDKNWKGVPIRLITGKALSRKGTEIIIRFKKTLPGQSDTLVLRVQPNEGLAIDISVKKLGYTRELEEHELSFSYPEDAQLPDAYEQVLVDSLQSEQSLFTSSDEVIRSWEILQPLLDSWHMSDEPPIVYERGTSTDKIIG